jgi:hypothetical protein
MNIEKIVQQADLRGSAIDGLSVTSYCNIDFNDEMFQL